MLFSLYCTDKPGCFDLRMERRPDHVAYLETQVPIIVYGGPLLDNQADKPVGSLLIINVADHDAAVHFSQNDPYTQAGLFAEVLIRPTRQVFPKN
jgi:uncharacterized protein YciI